MGPEGPSADGGLLTFWLPNHFGDVEVDGGDEDVFVHARHCWTFVRASVSPQKDRNKWWQHTRLD